ncbi:MAG: hypothetical protein NVSMB31_08760 [Vulcanimicrobiaceae bacterium]
MFGIVFSLLSWLSPTSPPPMRADVVIGAGHEGRPASCARFPKHKCNLGTAGEREYTPRVADEAARILRAAGFRVIRVPADFAGSYQTRVALFIHFDGNVARCYSGASIGYHNATDANAARAWRRLYKRYWPFSFQPDNFTSNLSNYYGFRQMQASDLALVLELGELTCAPQREWLVPRIAWEGKLIAHFVSMQTGQGGIADPGPFRQ